jgi:replicative DNA helicase
MASIADAPLAICAPKELTLTQVAAEAVDLASRFELRAVFIDGLDTFIDPNRANYHSTLESTLRNLRGIAEKLGIPIVACLPSNRPKPDQDSPRIERLTGGEIIEHIADIIIMLERIDQDEPQSPYAGEADLVVIKNKFGPQATVTTAFQGHYSRLVSMAPGYSSYARTVHTTTPKALENIAASDDKPL